MYFMRTALGSALLTLGLASFALAQEPFRWEHDLETAQRIASQTNRLVLVHFSAEWCEPCRKMEQEVFSQPGFGADLVPYYVAVKLDVDHYPSTKQQLGVSSIPADVVMTPDGQVLQRMKGALPAERYSYAMRYIATNLSGSKSGQVAQNQTSDPTQNAYVQPASGYAPQQAATAPPQSPNYPQGGANVQANPYASQPTPSSQRAPSAGQMASNDRYSEYYNRREQPQPSEVAPAYGQQANAGNTDRSAVGAAPVPSTPNYGAPSYTPPSQTAANDTSGRYPAGQGYNGGTADSRYGAAPQSAPMANRYPPSGSYQPAPAQTSSNVANQGGFTPSPFAANSQPADRYRNNTTPTGPAPGLGGTTTSASSSTSSYPGNQGGGTLNSPSPYGNPAGTMVGPQGGRSSQMAGQTSHTAASHTPPQLPPGSPPIGLEGYCPVTLALRKVWTPGDVRYGVVHRGRTYIFAGAAEKEQFFANPDQYSPVMSGNDPVLALDHKQLVPGHREHGVFFDNRVFLFSSESSLDEFSRNPSRYAAEVLQAMR